MEVLQRGGQPIVFQASQATLDAEDVEEMEDAPEAELETLAGEILYQATAARSIQELRAEIETLRQLEALALVVRRAGSDTKWTQLGSLLHEIFTANPGTTTVAEPVAPYGSGPIPPHQPSAHQKLVIFTEHRDTLNYLEARITTLLGRKSAVVTIHGAIGREERLKVQESFKHDPAVPGRAGVRCPWQAPVRGSAAARSADPSHPLLDAVIDLTLERHRNLLPRGVILVDETDSGLQPRVLFILEHAIQDAAAGKSGERRIISKRMLYVEIDQTGTCRHVHYAPYLDYRPLLAGEPNVSAILDRPECAWIDRDLMGNVQGYAIARVVPEHLAEVRGGRLPLLAKTEAAVKERLTKEITYWDHRAEQPKSQEEAGKDGKGGNTRLNSREARKRTDALQARLQKRLEELKLEAQISPLPPLVVGGLLVVLLGLLKLITVPLREEPGKNQR